MSASPTISGTKTAEPNRESRESVPATGLTDTEATSVRELIGREPNHL